MKKKTKLVFNILKPKSKALGFSNDELEGIAADIANNLTFEEEASDDEINEKITEEVDSVIPFLKIAQKASNRIVSKYKSEKNLEEGEEGNEGGEPKPEPKKKSPDTEGKEQPEWVKTIMAQTQAVMKQNESLQSQMANLLAEKETDSRRSKLKAVLKDSGTFGKTVLKNFDKMKFETETEFEDFLEGVTDDLAEINQERANEGLGKLGASAALDAKKKSEKPEALSEKEIEDLAATF